MGIRERSGEVNDSNRLVWFLYDLMRDHLPAGTVEKLVVDLEKVDADTAEFSNGWLAQYAQDVAARLVKRNG